MEDIKKSFWILFYLCAINPVFCQFLNSSLVLNPIPNCASESYMDPQENMEILNDAADMIVTLENVKESKLKKQFFQVINNHKKLEKVKSTTLFLQACKNSKLIQKKL